MILPWTPLFKLPNRNSANVTPRHVTGLSLTSADDCADLPGNDIMSILLLPSSVQKNKWF